MTIAEKVKYKLKVGKCSLKNHKENQTLSEQNHRREDLIQNARNAYLTIAEKTKLEVRETFT